MFIFQSQKKGVATDACIVISGLSCVTHVLIRRADKFIGSARYILLKSFFSYSTGVLSVDNKYFFMSPPRKNMTQ